MLKYIALSLLFVVSTLAVGRIVGGDGANIMNHPYQVSIQKKFGSYYIHICGGTIIAPWYIISAGHCFKTYRPEDFLIAAGSSKLYDPHAFKVLASQIIVHKGFNAKTLENDVALVLLSKQLPLNGQTMKTIRLATKPPPRGSWLSATGWGDTSFRGYQPKNLLHVYLPIMDYNRCVEVHSSLTPHINVKEGMICAGYDGVAGKGVCQGDSGSGLASSNYLYGVVSWTVGCGEKNYPSVFTDVAHYYPWIRQHVYIPEENRK